MDECRRSCNDCPARVLCHCLKVSEEAVVSAITKLALATVQEIRAHTGAGDGCACCHGRIVQLIERHHYAPADICSVR